MATKKIAAKKPAAKKLTLREQVNMYQDQVNTLQVNQLANEAKIQKLTTNLDEYKELVEAVKNLKKLLKEYKLDVPAERKFIYWVMLPFRPTLRKAIAKVLKELVDIIDIVR
jgi:L-lactate utilization protein LutB